MDDAFPLTFVSHSILGQGQLVGKNHANVTVRINIQQYSWCYIGKHSLQTPHRGSPLPAPSPGLIARGQTDSCSFFGLGTTVVLQSQSPSGEDGVSLDWSRGSRWGTYSCTPADKGMAIADALHDDSDKLLPNIQPQEACTRHSHQYQLSYE
ncbi:Hypothetical protein SMAX5B_008149 [Scophthalmus maximus]|uniref:Uncharacterized protein n=1 Tax=Scophthalmus maximus TaxID=52904 RepID=A0A2U9CT62_SCOMX|nr:Hypothetical protein SMAX5B_008149 [Scophthalmus maximus]